MCWVSYLFNFDYFSLFYRCAVLGQHCFLCWLNNQQPVFNKRPLIYKAAGLVCNKAVIPQSLHIVFWQWPLIQQHTQAMFPLNPYVCDICRGMRDTQYLEIWTVTGRFDTYCRYCAHCCLNFQSWYDHLSVLPVCQHWPLQVGESVWWFSYLLRGDAT